jgi:predicted anti-sigma-YlaC factor YlaD
MPFRDAYAQVAKQIQDGSFAGTKEQYSGEDLEIEKPVAELRKTQSWLRDRRGFLERTTARLFAWE